MSRVSPSRPGTLPSLRLNPPLAAGLLLLALNGISAARADDIPELRLMSATELKANAGGHFVTRASINGNDITVLVDTGATAVALSFEDARDAGLRPGHLDFNVPVATANGVARAARVMIDRIAVGSVEVDNVDEYIEDRVMQLRALIASTLGIPDIAHDAAI